jgi:hypothetical protein
MAIINFFTLGKSIFLQFRILLFARKLLISSLSKIQLFMLSNIFGTF